MSFSIYGYDDYKEALKAWIHSGSQERGLHSKLARAAGCQSSFLSQALRTHVHLTPDHIAGIAEFLGFSDDEHEYLQSLLTLARCSAPRLLRSCRTRIADLKRKNQDIAEKVQGDRVQGGIANEALYYSAWYWVAIHVLCSIEGYRKPQAIAQRLKLPEALVKHCLETMEANGVVRRDGPEWKPAQTHLHLSRESPLLQTHHANWRMQAAMKASLQDPDALQYSVLVGVSVNDYANLKNALMGFIEKSRAIVAPSVEEEIVYIGLDCFKL